MLRLRRICDVSYRRDLAAAGIGLPPRSVSMLNLRLALCAYSVLPGVRQHVAYAVSVVPIVWPFSGQKPQPKLVALLGNAS